MIMPPEDAEHAGPQQEYNWERVAEQYLRTAMATSPNDAPTAKAARALISIAASMVAEHTESTRVIVEHIARIGQTEYDRGWDAGQSEVASIREALFALLPRVEELEVRADLREALGSPYVLTPEEPDPERDWSKVRGELFTSSGKWKYSVRLDYTGERHRGVSGEGPHGWHFDGNAMAHRALARATGVGTSGVTIRELGEYWHLFVPNPPQGFPLWVQPEEHSKGFTPNAGEMFP